MRFRRLGRNACARDYLSRYPITSGVVRLPLDLELAALKDAAANDHVSILTELGKQYEKLAAQAKMPHDAPVFVLGGGGGEIPGIEYLAAANEVEVLSKELTELSEAKITGSGDTVIGPYGGYIDKAESRGASHFDIGSRWGDVGDEIGWKMNTHFLDVIGRAGDRVLLSVQKQLIDPLGFTAREVQYLQDSWGYVWKNQWSLRPG
jgi:hypothetical protein